jgi:hypothetical protein
MEILDFETVSPLFEMERDGIKPFTCRMWNGRDKRFEILEDVSMQGMGYGIIGECAIHITNPITGESFVRML